MENFEEVQMIRSLNNDHVATVIFINTTNYEIELIWINYEGQAVSFGRLAPGAKQPMSTYATHPWIFLETQTMDRFLVDGKEIFYPEPWFAKYQNLPAPHIPRRIIPDPVFITLPMYSLRDIGLRCIKRLLYDDNDAYLLDIPRNLQLELATMRPRKTDFARTLLDFEFEPIC